MSLAARRGLLPAGAERPALISHAGGNAIELARTAEGELADYLEVDLWLHKGRFEARHERRTFGSRLMFEKWYLAWAPREPFGLTDLLRATDPGTGIFLDLKNGGEPAAQLIRAALDASPSRRMVASSQLWGTLRAIERAAPEVDLFYSIDVAAKLDLFLSVAQRDVRPRGVSCRATLLDADTIAALHARDLLVVAWTVDDLSRASELAAMGVDGITTHRVAAIRERLASG